MNNYVCEHYHKFDNDCEVHSRRCPSINDDLKVFKKSLANSIMENNGRKGNEEFSRILL